MTAPVAKAVRKWQPGSWLRHALRMSKFGLVGLTGLVVNTVALWAVSGVMGVHYLAGVIVATQASTTWNFLLSEWWVFSDRQSNQGKWRRFSQFWAMNNLALVVRGPIVVLFTDVMGVHYLVSNVISLILVMVARYAFSVRVIWRSHDPVIETRPADPSPRTVG